MLAFGQITAEPQVQARAVPRQMRRFCRRPFCQPVAGNPAARSRVLLLRGWHRGLVWLDKLPPGAENRHRLWCPLLTRDMPTRNEGDRGILSSDTERTETAVLKVRNLTEESWPIHLVDQVPYSEQEDLEISSIDPTPTATDVDGQRGILAWESPAAGRRNRRHPATILRWPAEKSLQ